MPGMSNGESEATPCAVDMVPHNGPHHTREHRPSSSIWNCLAVLSIVATANEDVSYDRG